MTTKPWVALTTCLNPMCGPCRLGIMHVRDLIRLIEDDGWTLVRTRGSHRQYKHGVKAGLVTVPGQMSDDLAPGTLNSILKQAGLKP